MQRKQFRGWVVDTYFRGITVDLEEPYVRLAPDTEQGLPRGYRHSIPIALTPLSVKEWKEKIGEIVIINIDVW